MSDYYLMAVFETVLNCVTVNESQTYSTMFDPCLYIGNMHKKTCPRCFLWLIHSDFHKLLSREVRISQSSREYLFAWSLFEDYVIGCAFLSWGSILLHCSIPSAELERSPHSGDSSLGMAPSSPNPVCIRKCRPHAQMLCPDCTISALFYLVPVMTLYGGEEMIQS